MGGVGHVSGTFVFSVGQVCMFGARPKISTPIIGVRLGVRIGVNEAATDNEEMGMLGVSAGGTQSEMQHGRWG